jgi:hypothetical protein
MARLASWSACVVLLAACGSKPAVQPGPGDGGSDSGGGGDDADVIGDAGPDAPRDAPGDAAVIIDSFVPAPIDAFPAVLDLRINCRNDCVLVADPPAIDVAAGTSFEVNWINTGDTECDVAKVDQFNQVPIIIGLEPGTSYHDSVREWCGQFTGTFQFRVSICTIHSYIPVDCGGP